VPNPGDLYPQLSVASFRWVQSSFQTNPSSFWPIAAAAAVEHQEDRQPIFLESFAVAGARFGHHEMTYHRCFCPTDHRASQKRKRHNWGR
jgi:hypothetical protein